MKMEPVSASATPRFVVGNAAQLVEEISAGERALSQRRVNNRLNVDLLSQKYGHDISLIIRKGMLGTHAIVEVVTPHDIITPTLSPALDGSSSTIDISSTSDEGNASLEDLLEIATVEERRMHDERAKFQGHLEISRDVRKSSPQHQQLRDNIKSNNRQKSITPHIKTWANSSLNEVGMAIRDWLPAAADELPGPIGAPCKDPVTAIEKWRVIKWRSFVSTPPRH